MLTGESLSLVAETYNIKQLDAAYAVAMRIPPGSLYLGI